MFPLKTKSCKKCWYVVRAQFTLLLEYSLHLPGKIAILLDPAKLTVEKYLQCCNYDNIDIILIKVFKMFLNFALYY